MTEFIRIVSQDYCKIIYNYKDLVKIPWVCLMDLFYREVRLIHTLWITLKYPKPYKNICAFCGKKILNVFSIQSISIVIFQLKNQ